MNKRRRHVQKQRLRAQRRAITTARAAHCQSLMAFRRAMLRSAMVPRCEFCDRAATHVGNVCLDHAQEVASLLRTVEWR